MGAILRNLGRAFGRIFPDCMMLSQAIAFNMFLAFFPVLLLALGVLGVTSVFHDALSEIPNQLSLILPPGSTDVVFGYFVRKGAANPWQWMSLGLGGTILAGTQVMVGYMEGFRVIECDPIRPAYWRRQLRAIGLLCITIIPMLTVTVLTVFGKQARPWLVRHTGFPLLIRDFAFLFYGGLVFVLAMWVLVMLYGIGSPAKSTFASLLPGAVVSTVLWWAVDGAFGWYVRKMPYDAVYRGLASAIGLLLWMFLTALIVLLGAAYNAEARESSAPTTFGVL